MLDCQCQPVERIILRTSCKIVILLKSYTKRLISYFIQKNGDFYFDPQVRKKISDIFAKRIENGVKDKKKKKQRNIIKIYILRVFI